MSIKLFAINSFSLQFFDFVSSLKQTVNRNWVHFTFSRSKQFKSTFFWIYKPELSQFWALRTEHFIFDSFWMNDNLYCCWIHYRYFVTDSDLVSGFESTAVHEIRKYKFYDIACSDVLFVVHRYHYKFVGLAGSGIDPATLCMKVASWKYMCMNIPVHEHTRA